MYVWLHIALPIFLEILFLTTAMYCVNRAGKSRIYPAFWQLLVFGVASSSIQLADTVLDGFHLISALHAYSVYFYVYWVSFGISALRGPRTHRTLRRRGPPPREGIRQQSFGVTRHRPHMRKFLARTARS